MLKTHLAKKKAFSVLEYAVLIAILAGVLVGLSVLIQRSLSGQWRQGIDDSIGHGRQYDPHLTIETIGYP